MSPFWRAVSVVTACVAVVAGTLLLMGNLHHSDSLTADLEQSQLEAMARLWETRLELARSTFRDQVVRYDGLAILDHPEDWSQWRVQNKLDAMRTSWTKENGVPRGFALLNPDGRIHTLFGDTLRFAEAQKMLRKSSGVDVVLLGRTQELPEVLGIEYYSPPANPGQRPARLIALVDPRMLLTPFGETPPGWSLFADPANTLLSSEDRSDAHRVSDAAWTLMVSQRSGMVKQPDGGMLCFSRVQIPGMVPMLLLHTVPAQSAVAGIAAVFFALAGLGGLCVVALKKNSSPTTQASPDPASAESETAADPAGYRQIFQNITDPICVVDASGIVLRANRAAHEWLRLRRSRPDETVMVQSAADLCSAQEFLTRAAQNPADVCGECRLAREESVWEGTLEANRLFRNEEGHGPVLLHFHPRTEAPPEQNDAAYAPPLSLPVAENMPDPYSPFPVLAITTDGLIASYNEAARRTCPRLEDTPLLKDVLPELDGMDLSDVLARGHGSAFQSLFGPRAHEFTVIFAGEQILLYGHPLTDAQNLEIELKQAQENFYGLCALVPIPVLLVDPREHSIIEANAAAGDLFEVPATSLRGQTLNALSATPWEFAEGNDLFIAQTLRGRHVSCTLRYELIKVEGVPALMVVLENVTETAPLTDMLPEPETHGNEQSSAPAAPPVLPLGPGILITLDPTVREVARRLFEKCGHNCEAFTNLDDAVVWLITHDVRPEFMAIDLTDYDQVDNWITDLRIRCGEVPCIGFTDGDAFLLPNGGLNALLEKPFDLDSLNGALNEVHLEAVSCATV
jgi:PAS domain-containing protein